MSPFASSALRFRGGRRWLALALAAASAVWLAWVGLRFVPLPNGLNGAGSAGAEWLDREGRSLRATPGTDGRYQRLVPESTAPRVLVLATLAAEDARFWTHPGVDLRACLRAAWQFVRQRRIVSGASTISQQVIKLAEPRARTVSSKLVEGLQALRLEQVWDKERILAEYLRRLDYGCQAQGVAEAAREYFRKSPADLSLAEAAYLAGLPQAPSRLNPRRHPERAKHRQEWVLRRCRELGWVEQDELERALTEPIRLAAPSRPFAAPHFVGYARAALGAPPPVGAVRTSLDPALQRACEASLERRLADLAGQHAGNGAIVVISNRTGEVLSMVGSRDWAEPRAGQVNAALAPRSPGSALKPFTYLLAFQAGATAADVEADVPVEFATTTGLFRPLNYDRSFAGPVRLREALANSLNVPAVRLLDAHGGAPALLAALRACGISTLKRSASEYGLGLTLGDGEVRLLELANAYATIARLGEWRPCRVIAGVTPGGGQSRRVFGAGECWLVADILRDNTARALSFGLQSTMQFEFPVACKTGTSTDFRDNWAFGFTPEFTVGVWVGNSDGRPMENVSGVTGAGPILHDVIAWLHQEKGTGWFPEPPGLLRAQVHPVTGRRLAGIARVKGVEEVFLSGRVTPPETPSDYDARGRVRLDPEYAEWFGHGIGLADLVMETGRVKPAALRVLSPAPGTVFLLDADLPSEAQRAGLRASASCVWQSPTLRITETSGGFSAVLTPGRHRIEAWTPGSVERAETWIEVRRL